jgi:hypothetical protein
MHPAFERGWQVSLTKAWVITGGTNCGVMELVGQTMADQDSVCLGITSWGIVQDHEELERHSGFVHQYVPYQSRARAGPTGERAPLEPNHTHFIFADAGPAAVGEFGHEVALRANIEDAICAEATRDRPQTVIVMLVVGGGIGTLNTVLALLEKKRPVRALRDCPQLLLSRSLFSLSPCVPRAVLMSARAHAIAPPTPSRFSVEARREQRRQSRHAADVCRLPSLSRAVVHQVVVFTRSGGAARDIHQVCVRVPRATLAPQTHSS